MFIRALSGIMKKENQNGKEDERMKKTLLISVLLIVMTAVCFGGASGEAAHPRLLDSMPDFSVTTVDGGTFTLSEALKEKKAVLINIWASWCPPCRLEFPFLEKAYEEYRDQVEVIALSGETEDTLDILRAYAEERGMTFPVARDENLQVSDYLDIQAFPTSVIVDRFGRVAYIDAGAVLGTGIFEKLFEIFISDDYTQTRAVENWEAYEKGRYILLIVDQDYNGVPGCTVNFTAGENTQQVITDETGTAVAYGTAGSFLVQIFSLPEGYSAQLPIEGLLYEDNAIGMVQLNKQ